MTITDPVLREMLEKTSKSEEEKAKARVAKVKAEEEKARKQCRKLSAQIQRRYLDQIMKIAKERDVRQREIYHLLHIGESTLSRYKKGTTSMPLGDFVILAKMLKIQNISYNLSCDKHEYPDFVMNTSLDAEHLRDIVRPQLDKFKSACVRAGVSRSEMVDEIIAFLADLETEKCGKQILEAYKKFREYKERNSLFGPIEEWGDDDFDDGSDDVTQMECATV